MENEYDLVARTPKLYYDPNTNRVMLEMELIKFQDDLGQPSGRGILLGMSEEDAIQLLGLLKALQRQFDWPDAPAPNIENVPGRKHRN